jgi:hypothetical protein
MRIRTGWYKSLFVILFFVALLAVGYASVIAGLEEYIRYEFSGALVASAVYVGTRTFRGEGEEIAPPRPWWRMSARPTASFVLAAFFAMRSVFVSITVIDAISNGWIDLQFLALCALDPLIFAGYLNSGIRLLRAQTPEAPSTLTTATPRVSPSSSSGR